jgi:hypothetical protein
MRLRSGTLPATLTGPLPNAAKVQATLYQQTIPHYSRQRAEDANGSKTARLAKFTNELDVNKYTGISNRKLKIGGSRTVDIASGVGTARKSGHSLFGTSAMRRADGTADQALNIHCDEFAISRPVRHATYLVAGGIR